MDEGIPFVPADRFMVDYIRWALPKGPKTMEQEARELLLSLGYRIESPTERATRLAQAQWTVAGVDHGE